MSQTLKLTNFNTNNLVATTRLTDDVVIGTNTFPVQNTQTFTVGDYIVIGTLGTETAEMLIIQSIAPATSITTTANSRLRHSRYDYINSLFGNQIKLYRAANVTGLQPSDTDFSAIGSPVDIQPDANDTRIVDASGGSGYWYKATYYNSTTTGETNLADSQAARGGSGGNYCSIESIRNQAGFKNAPYISDAMIDAKRQAAQDEINSTLQGFYDIPFQPPINAFISDICIRLAAGLLLLEQYSAINTLNTADGQKRVDGARADLMALATKQKELTDENGVSIALPGSTGGVSAWPNETTADADAEDGGAPRNFRMSDNVGYFGSRKW